MNETNSRKDVALVIDDSFETLSMFNDVLNNAGLTVLVALEGRQGIKISENVTPDIIFLDAMMPQMDGFETCKKLKSLHQLQYTPIIFMTGLSDTQSVVKALEAGGVDYITKPINTEEMLVRMRVHLHNARLTIDAQTALDSTGQYLFSTDEFGCLLWSTPQAHALFEQLGIEDNHTKTLQGLLEPLLSNPEVIDHSIFVEYNGQHLEIHYVSRTKEREYLLRVRKVSNINKTDLLKNEFGLTQREADVLLWTGHGKSNPEIGIILSMSPRTVNKHLEMIFRKLEVENRTAAAIKAVKVTET